MFVDAEYDFGVVKNFFDKFFLPFFRDITLYDDFAGNHPVVSLSFANLLKGHKDSNILSLNTLQIIDFSPKQNDWTWMR